MNCLRRFAPCLVLGLTIAMAGVSFAQNANPSGGDKDKKASCCMSGGCRGDSCQMMKKDGMKNHVSSSDKDSCCGCCGDSCQMMKKDAVKNHTTSSDKDGCCCCGDSCEMKDNAAKTDGATMKMSSDKHECCCCGDSCNMKEMKNMKDMKEKP